MSSLTNNASLQRYFIGVSYHGGKFHGWQIQNNANSVQQEIENVLSTLFQSTIKITGSGRTDTGVHCVRQYFHVDLPFQENAQDLLYRCNSFLPKEIAFLSIHAVPNSAHARFDAIERKYEYHIGTRKNPLKKGLVAHVYQPLDLNKMNAAAKCFLGKNDFQCFSKVHTDVTNFVCDVKHAQWEKTDDGFVFTIIANRFLRGMVRAMVGTLVEVGKGKLSTENILEIMASHDRKKASSNMPAEGLFLVDVRYDSQFTLS